MFNVEHLAGASPDHDLLVFSWSPQTDWRVVNVSAITKQQIAGPVTSWMTDGIEQLAAAGLDEQLYVFWRIGSGEYRIPAGVTVPCQTLHQQCARKASTRACLQIRFSSVYDQVL